MQLKSARVSRPWAFLTGLLFISGVAFSQGTTDSTAADSILLKQIESQMQATTPPPPPQTRSAATANPDLSAIGDFQASYDSRGKKNFNTYLNETEDRVAGGSRSLCPRRFFYFVWQGCIDG